MRRNDSPAARAFRKAKKKYSLARLHIILQPKVNAWIVQRDGRCVHPECTKTLEQGYRLEASHFWNQGTYKQVQYDPENIDALCHPHHAGQMSGWEYKKPGEYRDWKIQQLGKKRFNALEARARRGHIDYTPALLAELTRTLKENPQHYETVYRTLTKQ